MSGLVPGEWMPRCAMQRIIVHWTAGAGKASALDREHYHVLIDDDGKLTRGKWSIADNVNTRDRRYAAHTLGANTGSIGVALCGMRQAMQAPFRAGPSPLTKTQWDRAMRVVADLARFYTIRPLSTAILSHAEVQSNLGIRQRGKWDIAILPFDLSFNTAKDVGDRMRREVAALI